MKFVLLISLFSPLALRLVTALAIPNGVTATTIAGSDGIAVVLNPRCADREDDKLNAEESHPTTEQRPGASELQEIPEPPSVEELAESANLPEDAENAEDFELSDLTAVLGGLRSSNGESPDLSNLATLLGKLLSYNQESGNSSNPGAHFEDAQASDEQLRVVPAPSPRSPPLTRPDAADEFIITSMMRGLGPRLPTSLSDTQPTIPNELVLPDGTPDWEALGKLSYLWGLFKQWQEAEENSRKEEDLNSKIRKAVGDFETYFRANRAEALEEFGPRLEQIRKASGNGA